MVRFLAGIAQGIAALSIFARNGWSDRAASEPAGPGDRVMVPAAVFCAVIGLGGVMSGFATVLVWCVRWMAPLASGP